MNADTDSTPSRDLDLSTRLAHAGRAPGSHAGAVNIPPYRASTILHPTLAAFLAPDPEYRSVRYGRMGTPSSHAFEEAMAELEGGCGAVAVGSGLQAITVALSAFVRAGDHILVTDSVYGPTRHFCDQMLARLGVETEFYDPGIGAGIAGLIRENTRLIMLESPGSLTFEMQDVPAIVAAARARGCLTLIDNTWAAGVFFKPLALGVDVSIQAATKYVCGHSDATLGVIVAREEACRMAVKQSAVMLGAAAGADDLFLALRGLRTLPVRLARHQETGIRLARWMAGQPEVRRVLHPALPDDPGHALWQRDFTGACGLFAVELDRIPQDALAAMLDGLSLFGMGYSWGGFESLILPAFPDRIRTAVPWRGRGTLIRLHAGLEDAEDLIRDLDRAFDRLRRTRR
ncbi:cystathionine beta-lyase [Rhodospirillum centenum]|uniref:Cystathionine beta-lyase n=1 Tax=Rhodospirillum centenum (strain ATCC 51521 / SW) TaxID=414684 RepID=B6IMI4_RHOCS|nr:cystathionine beta-lyase [Rhodospirillum centenum]ACI98563.1 cystathionine beta-lyase [Rhodospirillum centenum SW]